MDKLGFSSTALVTVPVAEGRTAFKNGYYLSVTGYPSEWVGANPPINGGEKTYQVCIGYFDDQGRRYLANTGLISLLCISAGIPHKKILFTVGEDGAPIYDVSALGHVTVAEIDRLRAVVNALKHPTQTAIADLAAAREKAYDYTACLGKPTLLNLVA